MHNARDRRKGALSYLAVHTLHLQRTLAFLVPTMCDATATTLLNIGLFYTQV
jgi:hypothetical protein